MTRAIGVALALAYPFAVHYGVVSGSTRPALVLLAALLGYAAAMALPAAPRIRWLLPVIAVALAFAAPESSVRLLDLPPILIPLALAWIFGRTLAEGHKPLISRFAELEQGSPLPADLALYTRRLTWTWTLFLIALAATSALLGASGHREAWSWFTNFISYGLLAGLLAGEYAYRRVRFRHYRHDSPLEFARRIRLGGLLRRR